MELIYKEDFGSRRREIIEAILAGKIFIYPTDTIYGLGCNAIQNESVQKIREIKGREDTKPLSVIAPSKKWIIDHCEVSDEKILDRLPGPYTLIFKRRDGNDVSTEVNKNDDTLGVRIPAHWFSEVVKEAGVPFVTTSVNLSGEKFMKKLADIPEEFKTRVAYCIYEGERKGIPSEKFDYAHGDAPGLSKRIPPITLA